MKKLKTKKNEGSSLIELLVAIVLIVSTLTALISGMTYTMRTLAEAEYRSRATDLAGECMDELRKTRIIKGWAVFKNDQILDDSDRCELVTDEDLHQTFDRSYDCTSSVGALECTVTVSWTPFSGSSNPKVKITQIFKQHLY